MQPKQSSRRNITQGMFALIDLSNLLREMIVLFLNEIGLDLTLPKAEELGFEAREPYLPPSGIGFVFQDLGSWVSLIMPRRMGPSPRLYRKKALVKTDIL